MSGKRVTVLMGGWSSEREVSLNSGKAAGQALTEAGFDVIELDLPREATSLSVGISVTAPHVVFNALHGKFGEDGRIQGLLDLMGIPYTHSGVLASALAMNKSLTKKIAAAAGVPVAEEVVLKRSALRDGDPMPRPYVIKPVADGSSVDIHILHEGDNVPPYGEADNDNGDEMMMVERFIPGRELTVAVMGDRALGVTEIKTGRGFYDYEAKYADGGSVHVVNPDDLPAAVAEDAMRLALLTHDTLGCRGVTRTDFRYDGDTLYMLEINTQPGLTRTSLVPEQAAAIGIDFPALVTWMVENAQCGD